MRFLSSTLAALGMVAAVGLAGPVTAGDDGNDSREFYEITVTNLTSGQIFTPLLAVSHRSGVSLFTPGQVASSELATLAESGNTVPLERALRANRRVADTDTAPDVLGPGQSVTLTVRTRGRFNRVSLAGMLVPTNDALVAVNGVRGPNNRNDVRLRVPAYDAGSEENDELCANIPGPPFLCNGVGESAPAAGDEGFVHIHRGIHGGGDLDEAVRDWRNPVADIVIRRVSR